MSTNRYASGTTVSVEKSRAELEALLRKHKAGQYGVFTDTEAARSVVQFSMDGRMVKLTIQYRKFTPTNLKEAPRSWYRWGASERAAYVKKRNEQEEREAWRRLILVTKGKLELIADGNSTVEREFLPDIMLPDGSTVGERIAPQIEEAYQTGSPPLLLGPAS